MSDAPRVSDENIASGIRAFISLFNEWLEKNRAEPLASWGPPQRRKAKDLSDYCIMFAQDLERVGENCGDLLEMATLLAADLVTVDDREVRELWPKIWKQLIRCSIVLGIRREGNPDPKTGEKNASAERESKPQKSENGPARPNLFHWNGKTIEMQMIPFKVLFCLWNAPEQTMTVTALETEVWGECADTDSRLKSAITRVKAALLDSKCNFTVRKSRDSLRLG
jgi:hypothetical protein